MTNNNPIIANDIQMLAERFVYENDDSAFICLWDLIGDNIRKTIYDYLVKKNCPRIQSLLDDIYDKTLSNIFDNSRKYYDKNRSKFITWAYAVAHRNCVSVLRPYVINRFYIANPDINDIEGNNLDDETYGKYRLEYGNEDKLYTYSINGCERVSNYEELMEDITNCVKSCIYYIEDNKRTNRPNREIFKKLYIENKYIEDVAKELSIEVHTVKNAVTYCRKNILKIFSDKYSDLYRVIKEENIFVK